MIKEEGLCIDPLDEYDLYLSVTLLMLGRAKEWVSDLLTVLDCFINSRVNIIAVIY